MLAMALFIGDELFIEVCHQPVMHLASTRAGALKARLSRPSAIHHEIATKHKLIPNITPDSYCERF